MKAFRNLFIQLIGQYSSPFPPSSCNSPHHVWKLARFPPVWSTIMALLVMERHFSCWLDWHDTVECHTVATDWPIRIAFPSFRTWQSSRDSHRHDAPSWNYSHTSFGSCAIVFSMTLRSPREISRCCGSRQFVSFPWDPLEQEDISPLQSESDGLLVRLAMCWFPPKQVCGDEPATLVSVGWIPMVMMIDWYYANEIHRQMCQTTGLGVGFSFELQFQIRVTNFKLELLTLQITSRSTCN
jgi:hypothetical protein